MFVIFIELIPNGYENMNIVNSWFAMIKNNTEAINPKLISIWPLHVFLFIYLNHILNMDMLAVLKIYNSKQTNKDTH